MDRQGIPDSVRSCFYCRHKDEQLKRALAAGNQAQVRDINYSLSQHLRRSHLPKGMSR